MASRSYYSFLPLLGGGFLSLLLRLLFLIQGSTVAGARLGKTTLMLKTYPNEPSRDIIFREAPVYNNGEGCGVPGGSSTVHVAMTLDENYLRGTMAAVLSILQHSMCPENLEFHFLEAGSNARISSSIRSTFPYLNFRVYRFDSNKVQGKISRSIRQALEQPLNYARIYLADLILNNVKHVIYMDSVLVVVDDIAKLWGVDLEGKVLAAPEYCHTNFSMYFTDLFWSDRNLARTFEGRKPCYFNTGVMVVDVEKWRQGGYTRKVEE